MLIAKVSTLKNMTQSRKLHIETYGCQMNVADSEVVASIMETVGYEMYATP